MKFGRFVGDKHKTLASMHRVTDFFDSWNSLTHNDDDIMTLRVFTFSAINLKHILFVIKKMANIMLYMIFIYFILHKLLVN